MKAYFNSVNGKMSSKIYHNQVTPLITLKLNSCNEDDEHSIETVYYIHLKPIVLSEVRNLIKGGWSTFFLWHVKNLFLLHCVPLYVCRLCIDYQDLRTNLLRMAALRILLLTFISHFVIDFLSI